MKKQVILSLIILIIIAGSLYFFYINKSELSENYSNVSISAHYNEKQIKTGYIIETKQGQIKGNTTSYYELNRIKNNQIIIIKNVNLENQSFYEEEIKRNLSSPQNLRIDINLEKPEEIKVNVTDNGSLLIDVFSKNFKNIDFCLEWSINYIFVKAPDFKQTTLSNFTDWDRCYIGNFSLKNNSKKIEVDYTKFGELEKNDFIKIIFIDYQNNTKIVNIK